MHDSEPPVDARTSDDGAFETLLWEMFLRFVELPGDRVEDAIRDAQRRLCEAFALDRSALWQNAEDDETDMRVTHLFERRGVPISVDELTGSVDSGASRVFPLTATEPYPATKSARASFPWLMARLRAGLTTAVTAIDDLPAVAVVDAQSMRRAGTVSTVVVPLKAESGVLGCVTFATTTEARTWPEGLVRRFELVAQVFARAISVKRTAQLDREHAAHLALALADLQTLRDQLQVENRSLRDEVQRRGGVAQVVGTSASIRAAIKLAEQVAPTGATVLLLGETGTGKERFANYIHEHSPRHGRPMVRVNCAAIPATLIESELFGREKGAFTGALARQIGRFELAIDSTIFLDEIGDLPPDIQVKLLRVIEERHVERLGSPRPVPVNVRIIAATHRDLERAVREGTFREDLYYRLNVFPITLPPLRDRLEDIPLLARSMVDELGMTMGKRVDPLSQGMLKALRQYHWPGNIRELRNVLERAMITSATATLQVDMPAAADAKPRPSAASLGLKDVERSHILEVLKQVGWRIRGPLGAAAVLGLPPTTLENRMNKLGISRPHQKASETS